MRIHFLFDNVKPINLNNSQKITTIGKFARKYKTDESKIFESNINNQLRKFKNDINKFNKQYDKANHYINADYRFYMPILLKDKSRVSKRSGDLSNCVKNLEDIIFKQLHADDGEVVNLNITKIESNTLRIEVDLELKPMCHIN